MNNTSNIKTAKVRLSNIELLRIVSMMMVLAVHIDGAPLGLPAVKGNFNLLDSRQIWKLAVESLAIVGVNCFTLISGYFGIRLKWKSVGAYLFQCIFYSVGIYLIFCSYDSFVSHNLKAFSIRGFIESCMVLTHTDLWYVPAYFLLMLLSPFINAGFENMSTRNSAFIVGVFVFFNIWGGWLWGGKFNPTGYTIIQLVMMYCIGRVIFIYRKDTPHSNPSKYSLILATVYIIATGLTVLGACYNTAKAFAYNQPAVIIASVSLFLCFENMSFRSSLINCAAKSAFAVYLIHKTPLIWVRLMKPGVLYLWNTLSLPLFSLIALLLIILIYLIAMAIDPIRRWLSAKIIP